MCIAIVKPFDVKFDMETYKHCYKVHPDGWGFALAQDDGNALTVVKDITSFEHFAREVEQYEQHTLLIHFRKSTGGALDMANCHPFRVGEDLVFMHNGTISCPMTIKDRSDTYNFNEHVLKPIYDQLGADLVDNAGIKLMAEKYIGYSKIAFLDTSGQHYLWNDKDWVTHDSGHLYSNTSYKPYAATTYSLPPQRKPKKFTTSFGTVSAACSAARSKQSPRLAQQDSLEHAERVQYDTNFDIAYDTEDLLPVEAQHVDYENAKTCESLGLPPSMIRDMYHHDPDLLDAVAMHYEPMPTEWLAGNEENYTNGS